MKVETQYVRRTPGPNILILTIFSKLALSDTVGDDNMSAMHGRSGARERRCGGARRVWRGRAPFQTKPNQNDNIVRIIAIIIADGES